MEIRACYDLMRLRLILGEVDEVLLNFLEPLVGDKRDNCQQTLSRMKGRVIT